MDGGVSYSTSSFSNYNRFNSMNFNHRKVQSSRFHKKSKKSIVNEESREYVDTMEFKEESNCCSSASSEKKKKFNPIKSKSQNLLKNVIDEKKKVRSNNRIESAFGENDTDGFDWGEFSLQDGEVEGEVNEEADEVNNNIVEISEMNKVSNKDYFQKTLENVENENEKKNNNCNNPRIEEESKENEENEVEEEEGNTPKKLKTENKEKELLEISNTPPAKSEIILNTQITPNYKQEEEDELKNISLNIPKLSYNEAFNKTVLVYNKIKDIIFRLKLESQVLEEAYSNVRLQLNRNLNQNKENLERNLTEIFENLNPQKNSKQNSQQRKKLLCNYLENSRKLWIFDIVKFKGEVKEIQGIKFKFSTGMSIELNETGSIVFISGGIATGNSSEASSSFMNFFSGGSGANPYETEDYVVNFNPEKDDKFSNMLMIYFWERERFEILKMTHKKAFHASLYYENKLYIIGGAMNFSISSKDCVCFNWKTRTWELLPPLNQGRANPSICIYNENIVYCFRGFILENSRALDSIEWMNLDTIDLNPKWNLFIPEDPGMSWQRMSCSGCIVISESQIFIFGGFQGLAREKHSSKEEYQKSCFIFNPLNKTVYRACDLYKGACFINSATFKENSNSIISVDYKNEGGKMFGVHSFCFDSKKWKFIN